MPRRSMLRAASPRARRDPNQPARRPSRPWIRLGPIAALLVSILAGFGASPAAFAPVPARAAVSCDVPTSGGDPSTSTSDNTVYDYVILFDVSASMEGFSDPNNNGQLVQTGPSIFPQVKGAVTTFLRQVPANSEIRIVPFAGNYGGTNPSLQGGTLDGIRSFSMADEAARSDSILYIDQLVADGRFTWITKAVRESLVQLKAMRDPNDTRTHVQTLLLYTDGAENDPEFTPTGFQSLVQSVADARKDEPFLYVKYVSLGVEVNPELKKQLEDGGIQVVNEAQGQVSSIVEVRVSPPTVGLTEDFRTNPLQPLDLCFTGTGDGSSSVVIKIKPSLSTGHSLYESPRRLTVFPSEVAPGPNVQPIDFGYSDGNPPPDVPGDQRVTLLLTTDDPRVLLIPQRITVQFKISAIPTPTPVPTDTPTDTPVPTETATPIPTETPVPTETPTAIPTETPIPTATPTATPTDTPIPTSTLTPIPTETPTPVPTSTPTPSPTITVTPVPTDTPVPTVTPLPTATATSEVAFVPVDFPTKTIDMGDGDEPVIWTMPISPTLSEGNSLTLAIVPAAGRVSAGGAGTGSPVASPAAGAGPGGGAVAGGAGPVEGSPGGGGGDCGSLGATASFAQAGSTGLTEVTFDSNNPSANVQVSVERAALESLGEGSIACQQQLKLTPKVLGSNVNVPGAQAQPDGSYLLPLDYSARVNQPFDMTPVYMGVGGAAALFAFLAGLYSTTPRLPNKSRLVPNYGNDDALLRAQERQGGRGRLLGRRITAGGTGDDVDLGFHDGGAASFHGRWGLAKETVIKAEQPGITVDGFPLEEGESKVLKEGSDVWFGPANQFTYTKQ